MAATAILSLHIAAVNCAYPQLAAFLLTNMTKGKAKKPKRQYYPPRPEVIELYAHKVCRNMGKEYNTTEVISGFTGFMKTLVKIHIQYLNQQEHKTRR